MRPSVYRLNEYFVRCLGDSVVRYSDISTRPLDIIASFPEKKRLRVYVFNATNPPGGRPAGEYKITLNLKQQPGTRANFDYSGGFLALLVGYVEEYDVFVIWDASRHSNIPLNKNVQVKTETVLNALVEDLSFQERSTKNGLEIVIAVRPKNLKLAIKKRIDLLLQQVLEEHYNVTS
jgi:hypothetical protein